ncbi:MAG TPA: 4-hydroxy-tetrahydrodipicolinate synthase [Candidatus Methylomirabilis sp.]|nr:4-hydroxy-tetrahydrodipicolinate synthase [Candidatus Methylomirabilis sp.]HSC71072.1 4-hydroxy-tetrahydrodipicolinate synthase [Candidatus Methylomirabilis sp.]
MAARELIRPVGSWVALVTPFTTDDVIDFPGFQRLVDFQVAGGTDGLLFMGSTGEATSLSGEERRSIIREMTAYCRGRIPAFFGVTCPTTRATVDLAQYAQAQGADGILLVVPPYIAPPQGAVLEFLRTAARSVDIAVAIYNNPSRVIVNMDPETIVRLAQDCPNVVADKEAMPNVSQLTEVYRGTEGRLHLLCCDFPKYDLILPTLAIGGHGTANVAGNIIPREMASQSRPWRNWEDVERTRKLYLEFLPILKVCYAATNPVSVKGALKLLGLPGGDPRPPLPRLEGAKQEEMRQLLERFQLRERYGL